MTRWTEAEELINDIPCIDTRMALRALLNLVSYVYLMIPEAEG